MDGMPGLVIAVSTMYYVFIKYAKALGAGKRDLKEMADLETVYKGRNVLITGGLGFIGSNLAIKLVSLGANVTLIDSLIPEYGGNLFNIEPVKGRVNVNFSDVRDEHSMKFLVKGQDYLFNLAGQTSHIDSCRIPMPTSR